jgi:hypothetical protein
LVPWLIGEEKPRCAGQILAMAVTGGEGEQAREDQGTKTVLARGDAMVGVDRRGWNGGEPRRWRWSSTTAAVFRCDGSLAVDQRWGNSSRRVRRFD